MTFDGGVFRGAMLLALRWLGWLTMPVALVVSGVALTFRSGLPDFTALDALDIVGPRPHRTAASFLVTAIVGIAWLIRRLLAPPLPSGARWTPSRRRQGRAPPRG